MTKSTTPATDTDTDAKPAARPLCVWDPRTPFDLVPSAEVIKRTAILGSALIQAGLREEWKERAIV